MRCPVCKTPLWTDPLFTPPRINCPRCGAVFKSTVPWKYFRILVLLVVVLCVFIITSLPVRNLWLLLIFLIGLLLAFWYVPRLIDLQHIPEALQFPERLAGAEQLRLEDQNREERNDLFQKGFRFPGWLLLFLLAMVGVIFFLFSVLA